jgi:hypothetical protein
MVTRYPPSMAKNEPTEQYTPTGLKIPVPTQGPGMGRCGRHESLGAIGMSDSRPCGLHPCGRVAQSDRICVDMVVALLLSQPVRERGFTHARDAPQDHQLTHAGWAKILGRLV